MDFPQLLGALQTLGLPVVLVLWFMLRTEKVIEKNTEALHALREVNGRELEALRRVLDQRTTTHLKQQ